LSAFAINVFFYLGFNGFSPPETGGDSSKRAPGVNERVRKIGRFQLPTPQKPCKSGHLSFPLPQIAQETIRFPQKMALKALVLVSSTAVLASATQVSHAADSKCCEPGRSNRRFQPQAVARPVGE
jgi:hypothetical protein